MLAKKYSLLRKYRVRATEVFLPRARRTCKIGGDTEARGTPSTRMLKTMYMYLGNNI
ncbi:uncharacterized protein L969DRAFT_92970 [Mixia osmundae IAM 14324]|uniref:Uncharacterized protein n=1 Tax=Mixia osmundae (strain CBS 9802 / IAM 14324 / JCM 22182 / KY 12970) TaxID=764103 RepID=G7DTX8_MIXOS|nr:uncharacterized protein L969DRAFT_92970 [Mixia osmundae IAM 14324]KEI41751.1 hypothetical protein L969DRAFT_92970 [Mixia osmundae IAM 14324]GAA94038.1 hypothetical protein E5Q_00685 [Mixia osmundae IAM 14324]